MYKTDIELEQDVKDKLAFEPSVDNSKIHVSIKNSIVTLLGVVSSLFEKTVAERTIRSVAGVKGIANELQVDLDAKNKRTDTEIASAAVDALSWNAAIPNEAIQVLVENGHVTLAGNVNWNYQRNNAEKIIRNLIGVKNVNNQIVIQPSLKIKDIKSKIMKEFHRNASIDAKQIDVEIIDNKVILKGKVSSWPEIQEATRAAWAIPGVTHVDSQLIISRPLL